MNPTTDAIQLLKQLHKGGNFGYYWRSDNKQTTWFKCDHPAQLTTNTNIYFGVHPIIERKQGRGTKETVQVVNCLFAEFDAKDFSDSKEAALNHILDLELNPSACIDSGGGYHCYWFLDNPIYLDDDNRGEIDTLQKNWVKLVGGDPGAADLARVLRVPGSFNAKYNPPRLVQKEWLDPQLTFTLHELENLITISDNMKKPDINIPKSTNSIPNNFGVDGAYWLEKALDRLGTRGRNETGFWLACQLRDNGMGAGQAHGIMLQYKNMVPPKDHKYTEKEALDSLEMAYSGTPREPARKEANYMNYTQPTPPPPDDEHFWEEVEKEAIQENLKLAPELPDYAKPDPALVKDAGKWINTYIDYSKSVSPMTPATFHESAALFMVSVVIARRVKLSMPYATIYPNLFIAWLAETTLYKKSTALNITRKILYKYFSHLLTAQDFTVESFISDMAGIQPNNLEKMTEKEQDAWKKERDFAAQRGLVLDEFSGLLAAAGKDYNGGLLEATLHFYDCDPLFIRSTKAQGRIAVRNSYLSFLGASTPAAVGQHLTQERLWSMGWWARMIILTPENRPTWKEPIEIKEPEEISSRLININNRLPAEKFPDEHPTIDATIDPDAFKLWQKYNKALQEELLTDDLDHILWGAYGRLPTHALKAAIILSVLDWGVRDPAPKIEIKHITRALIMAENWRESLHRAIGLSETSEYNRLTERILKVIGKAGAKGITMRNICLSMQDKPSNIVLMQIDDMMRSGLVEMQKIKKDGPGRPAEYYFLVTE